MLLFHGDRLVDFYVPSDQLLRLEIRSAVHQYFAQGTALTPTEAEYEAWLLGLPGPLYAISRGAGFQCALLNRSFRRFVLEVRGFSLYEYLVEQLSPEALALWGTFKEQGSGLDPNDWNYHGRQSPVSATPRQSLI
ncbi:MAG TPA: hypothetical protein VF690_21910 [Hymenobacter sp.]|jgi:hypothetical protein